MNNMGLGIAMNVKGNFKTALTGIHGRWSKFRAGIKTGVANIGAKIKGLGAKFKTFKSNMLGVFASVLVGVLAFKKIIGVSVKFQQAIANVAAISGESQKELGKLARVAGMNTVFSAREAADAMYFLASAGLKTIEMSQVLTPTLNLAAAAAMGIAETTDLVVNNLKVFGNDMSRAKEFTDVMAKTVTASNTDLAQLGQALSYSGATASVAGVKFQDLNAILATMADQGVKGTRAGTQLRMALTRLMAPGGAATAVLEKYHIKTAQLTKLLPTPIKLFEFLNKANLSQADALKLLGTRQANVFSIIKNGIPRMKEMQKTLEDAGGTAEKMALIQVDTLSGAMKLLRSAFEEIIISGSTGLLPVFKSIIWILIKVMRAFIKLPGPVKAVIGVILFLIPVILILTKVVMAFGVALSAAIWPVTLIVLGIAALITVVWLLVKYWDYLVYGFRVAWFYIMKYRYVITIFNPLLGIPLMILRNWRKVIDFFKLLWDYMTKFGRWTWDFFGAIFDRIVGWFKSLGEYINWILTKMHLISGKEIEMKFPKAPTRPGTKVEEEKMKKLFEGAAPLVVPAPDVTVNNLINIGNEKVHDSQKDYIKEYNLRNFVFVR